MINDLFENFIKNYKGPKLAFIVTGGGIGVHELAQTPGASKFLHAIYVPYSYEESERFIDASFPENNGGPFGLGRLYTQKAVSAAGARLLCEAGRRYWPTCKVIACTAATTTNRYRHGENEAFISVCDLDNHKTDFHLKLTKIPEEDYKLMGLGYASWKRRVEDIEITKFLLKIAAEEKP